MRSPWRILDSKEAGLGTFHDSYVRGLRWERDSFQFCLDIIYISEWLEPDETSGGRSRLRIADGVLEFDNVRDLSVSMDWSKAMLEAHIQELTIAESSVTPSGHPQHRFEIELSPPDGVISLWSTDYRVVLLNEPTLSSGGPLAVSRQGCLPSGRGPDSACCRDGWTCCVREPGVMVDLGPVFESARTADGDWCRADVWRALEALVAGDQAIEWEPGDEEWGRVLDDDGVVGLVCARIPVGVVLSGVESSRLSPRVAWVAVKSMSEPMFRVEKRLLEEVFGHALTDAVDSSCLSIDELWYATVT